MEYGITGARQTRRPSGDNEVWPVMSKVIIAKLNQARSLTAELETYLGQHPAVDAVLTQEPYVTQKASISIL